MVRMDLIGGYLKPLWLQTVVSVWRWGRKHGVQLLVIGKTCRQSLFSSYMEELLTHQTPMEEAAKRLVNFISKACI